MRESPRSLSPEQRVLLACARRDFTAPHLRDAEAAIKLGIDWAKLEQDAVDHGVAFFVGSHLLAHELVDVARRDQWQAALRRETARSMILRDWQQRIARAATEADVPIVWFKGLILSEALYRRSDARQCSDLDLLTPTDQMAAVGGLLEQLGFAHHASALPGKDEHPMGSHHVGYVQRSVATCPVLVEVHERLSGPADCQPATTGLLARARQVEFGGVPLRVLALEDELLMLVLHAHQHNYVLLRCLMDVAEFVQRFAAELDWPMLVERARESRCVNRLAAGLQLAHKMLGLGAASNCLERVRGLRGAAARLVDRLDAGTLLDAQREQDEGLRLRLTVLMDGWRDMMRVYAPRVFPPRAYVRALCPPKLRRVPLAPYLCYFVRVTRQMLLGRVPR